MNCSIVHARHHAAAASSSSAAAAGDDDVRAWRTTQAKIECVHCYITYLVLITN